MKKIKALIYGPAGRGKTTLARTVINDPYLEPLLLLSFEGGVRSAIGSVCNFIELDEIGKNPTSLDVYEIQQWSDFNTIYRRLEVAQHTYKTLFIDSLSELNAMALAEFSGAAKAARTDFNAVRIPQIQDYGKTNQVIDLLMRLFRDLDMNVIFTAGAEQEVNSATQRLKYYPALTGKLKYKVSHVFDMVGFYGIKEDEDGVEYRCLRFDSSDKYEAKVRDEHNTFTLHLIEPTLPKLLQELNRS